MNRKFPINEETISEFFVNGVLVCSEEIFVIQRSQRSSVRKKGDGYKFKYMQNSVSLTILELTLQNSYLQQKLK